MKSQLALRPGRKTLPGRARPWALAALACGGILALGLGLALSQAASLPHAAASLEPVQNPLPLAKEKAELETAVLRAKMETDILVLKQLRRRGSVLSARQAVNLAQVIIEEAHRHNFEPALVLAVIEVESSGRPTAVSPVGARGLMQIMPPTGKELANRNGIPWEGPDTLFDPAVNVKLGVAYLRKLTDRYQDVTTALAAYNWGPGRIDRRLRSGKGVPTLYPNRVLEIYGAAKRTVSVGRS
ncbi:MAG: lytic transglycosylase domain-containing protein [Myxococcota bacterium]|nr:lytic transglycosylase domain-containing protein [Myxococcota bacterium]